MNYVAYCRTLAERIDFRGPSPVGSPDGSPFDVDKLTAIVRANERRLPLVYTDRYSSHLVANMQRLTEQLKEQFEAEIQQGSSREAALADVRTYPDTLVGAVRDWGVAAYAAPLGRFEAVVSNLYRSFLDAEKRANLNLRLAETIPPLVTFAPTAEAGPFTLPVNAVRSFIGARVGVVSLPGSYREHPLVWPALAHETGGHDVLHADPGLIPELARGVSTLPGLPRGVGSLWASWIDEAASDVYGILNIGPSFAVSLAGLLAAFRAPKGSAPDGSVDRTLPMSQGQLVDPHPVDLLRIYLAMGVVGALRKLSVAKRQEWLDALKSVAQTAAGDARTIDVVDLSSGSMSPVDRLPLAAMADAAQSVGAYIATAELHAFDGAFIQDIETWDDADETAAATISAACAAGREIVALGDDAQLLAGTTMALLENAKDYERITASLAKALDDSFARDPFFGATMPHRMFPTDKPRWTRSHTPAVPQLPALV